MRNRRISSLFPRHWWIASLSAFLRSRSAPIVQWMLEMMLARRALGFEGVPMRGGMGSLTHQKASPSGGRTMTVGETTCFPPVASLSSLLSAA